jgi:hypothetical protein
VKRKNRAIVRVAEEIVYDHDLPRFLWEYVCNTAVYIQDKCPYRVLGRKNPKEVFREKKPKVQHFHIFGFLVYYHIPS